MKRENVNIENSAYSDNSDIKLSIHCPEDSVNGLFVRLWILTENVISVVTICLRTVNILSDNEV